MYSLTIQPPSSITQAILGQFAGTKEQQIVTASGSRLIIHRPDPTQAKITTILSQDLFGTIRTLAAFRLAGSNKGTRHSVTCELHIVIRKVSRGSSPHSRQCHGLIEVSRQDLDCRIFADPELRLYYHRD